METYKDEDGNIRGIHSPFSSLPLLEIEEWRDNNQNSKTEGAFCWRLVYNGLEYRSGLTYSDGGIAIQQAMEAAKSLVCNPNLYHLASEDVQKLLASISMQLVPLCELAAVFSKVKMTESLGNEYKQLVENIFDVLKVNGVTIPQEGK